jgi:hypothetical protein
VIAIGIVCLLAAQDPGIVATVDEAFRLAGVRTMLDSLPSHVDEMTAAALAQMPRDQRRQLEPVVRDVSLRFLSPDAFSDQLRAYFVQHYEPGRMSTFLVLERTPVYRTMHRHEEMAQTVAAQASRRRFELNLKSNPPAPGRVRALQRLDEVRGTTETEVQMVTGLLNAMSAGMGAQMPKDLEAQSTAFKNKIRPVLAGNVLMRNLFTYRNASDADIEDYVTAGEQKDVAWFNRMLHSAVLVVAADRAGRAGELIKKKVAQPAN